MFRPQILDYLDFENRPLRGEQVEEIALTEVLEGHHDGNFDLDDPPHDPDAQRRGCLERPTVRENKQAGRVRLDVSDVRGVVRRRLDDLHLRALHEQPHDFDADFSLGDPGCDEVLGRGARRDDRRRVRDNVDVACRSMRDRKPARDRQPSDHRGADASVLDHKPRGPNE